MVSSFGIKKRQNIANFCFDVKKNNKWKILKVCFFNSQEQLLLKRESSNHKRVIKSSSSEHSPPKNFVLFFFIKKTINESYYCNFSLKIS
jgi:hypothetical protein